MIDQLEYSPGQAGPCYAFKGELGKHLGRPRVPGIRFGKDRISRGNGGGKIPSRCRVEGKRKVVGAEHNNRPAQWAVFGADIGFCIDRGPAPRAISRRLGRLAQLICRPGKLSRLQPRFFWQSGFLMSDPDQLIGMAFDTSGEIFQEIGDGFGGRFEKSVCGRMAGFKRFFNLSKTRDGIIILKPSSGGWIDSLERADGRKSLPPRSIDKHRLKGHQTNL